MGAPSCPAARRSAGRVRDYAATQAEMDVRATVATPDPPGRRQGMSDEWRVGRKVGRTIYRGDTLIGVMDTPELAREAVEARTRLARAVSLLEEAVQGPLSTRFTVYGEICDFLAEVTAPP